MPREKTEAADYKGWLLRLPEEKLEACKGFATQEHRSLNAQLVWMIEQMLEQLERQRDKKTKKKTVLHKEDILVGSTGN